MLDDKKEGEKTRETPKCWRSHRVLIDGKLVRAGKLIAKGKVNFKCELCGWVFRETQKGRMWHPPKMKKEVDENGRT